MGKTDTPTAETREKRLELLERASIDIDGMPIAELLKLEGLVQEVRERKVKNALETPTPVIQFAIALWNDDYGKMREIGKREGVEGGDNMKKLAKMMEKAGMTQSTLITIIGERIPENQGPSNYCNIIGLGDALNEIGASHLID